MGEVRMLTRRDTPEVFRILDRRPIDNIVASSKVSRQRLEPAWTGSELIGYFEGPHLVSALVDGFSLHPINATDEALDAFSSCLEHRRCSSILGVRDEAMGLWERLCTRSFPQWASPREVRDHQKVMAISQDPAVVPSQSVEVITTRHLDRYLEASIAMYTEEVGVAPISPQGSYRDHVTQMMMKGHSYGVLGADSVLFKADVVATSGMICQIGGVWLAPQLRGQGLSKTFMAGVVAQCRQRFSTVSLYVNHYNLPAVRCYESVGFTQVGECATIMY
ncbi:MAG: GNAT family N-acetyltransferase [Propionibacteriaceae bacterium]|nr:GNAT family N-acetyltransferase [Propionibacteriaceae bacterium]